MMNDLYLKRNDRKINVLYPTGGNKNVLRNVRGVKLRSFTGPNGKGITVQENNGADSLSVYLEMCWLSVINLSCCVVGSGHRRCGGRSFTFPKKEYHENTLAGQKTTFYMKTGMRIMTNLQRVTGNRTWGDAKIFGRVGTKTGLASSKNMTRKSIFETLAVLFFCAACIFLIVMT